MAASAGTARQAQIKPDIPSHMFPVTQPEGNNSDIIERPHSSKPQSQALKSKAKNTRSQRDFDVFEGDDLQLDDFLITDQHRNQAKASSEKAEYQFDEADWLSIDSTPSPPLPKPATSREKGDDWAADMGLQEDDEYEPVRLANGNWACNHRCKDKTR